MSWPPSHRWRRLERPAIGNRRRAAAAYNNAKAVNAAAGGGIDDVIDPADTRDWIASGLKHLPPVPVRTTKKYPYIDPW